MIELVSFLKRIIEQVPDYKKFGHIYLELEKDSGQPIVFDSVRGDTIMFKYHEKATLLHTWSPNRTGLSKIIVDKISLLKPLRSSVIDNSNNAFIISTHKIFRKNGNEHLPW